MNEREKRTLFVVIDRLRPLAKELVAGGWAPELVVLLPAELERLPGYKVALVVPLDTVPEA